MIPGETGKMRDTALHIFQGLANSYDVVADYATLFQDRHWKMWASRRLATTKAGRLLDLGCGTLLMAERMAGTGWSFVGVDLTAQMLRKGSTKELTNVELLVNGDAETLPFQEGSFDSIVSCYVPKYVKTSRLSEELSRVAKPGACAVLYDFARPRGIAAPFLNLYIHVALRAAGFLLRLGQNSAAFAFDNLPRIIDKTRWDGEIVGEMEKRGFRTVAAERLTGGTVFAYCGVKGARA